ncbi:SET domain-containing protein [Blastomyces dermatitidis ER-3]|uniref:SET domain-containing protein n=1 Tax=Ajellomyces dermatitidis (strain ER-3 / ATCC MYA-2586) TaxID=559297 RepID=A0ABM9YID1_AJEDR|nr:SET domain-containing protein [Blastomyces dermatitidis ER-3]EEQ90825.1 SET domain-containing protein [Blastomyces dermatitidis ER-3]
MHRSTSSAGPEHEKFTEWAISQGIQINGVAPTRFPGQGVGIAAQRKIHAGEVVVRVPISEMLTIKSVPSTFREKFPDNIPVQGLYAAYICCTEEFQDRYAPWRAVWPSRQDLGQILPTLWPQLLKGSASGRSVSSLSYPLLPPSISGSWNTISKRPIKHAYTAEHQNLLPEQEKRLDKAYHIVKQVLQDVDKDLYTYYWLIVHTRSFHYIPAGTSPPKDHNDAMALCPFGDYFNHIDEGGCEVSFDNDYYTFRTSKSYDKGEEIFISYGNHSCDILLTDYGFIPAVNKWDDLFLDDIILKDFSSKKIEALSIDRYLGNYQITTKGPCFRTEVAACMKYMTLDDWNQYILGYQPASFDQRKTNSIIAAWIHEYIHEAEVAISKLTALRRSRKYGGEPQFDVISMRWKQIVELCNAVLKTVD